MSTDSAFGRTNGAPALIGDIVAVRLSSILEEAGSSRVVYAMVDLGKEVTSAIGEHVSKCSRSPDGRIEVAIHPDFATKGLSPQLVSRESATWFRNHGREGVLATLFSVPGQQMDQVLQSLGSVQRINDSWILDPTKARIWSDRVLPSYVGTDIHRNLTAVLEGLMKSGILASSRMLGEFCVSIRESMTGGSGLNLPRAISHAFPYLHLPRNCITNNEAASLIDEPIRSIRRIRDEFQRHLYLRDNRGRPRLRTNMLNDIERLLASGDLSNDNAKTLRALVNDKEVTTGVWRPSQEHVVQLPWPEIRQFFQKKRAPRSTLGSQTIEFLDDEHPGALRKEERRILRRLKGVRGRSTPALEAVYSHHRERLREVPRLYKQWLRLIFDKPIQEDDDLLLGLIALAERALRTRDESDDSQLVIRLRTLA